MANKFRQELPRMAYIEAQVIHRALRGGTLSDSVRAVEEQYKVAPGSLGSGVFFQTRVACLLYCLILIPKEVWSLSQEHMVYQQIRNLWTPDTVTKIKRDKYEGKKKYENDTVYNFIHHLRNSVAHARISIDQDIFKFSDRPMGKNEDWFIASLPVSELMRFLEVVGSTLANLAVTECTNDDRASLGSTSV